jgi:hypothetical protein
VMAVSRLEQHNLAELEGPGSGTGREFGRTE